jgi:hypothetical protein
MLAAAGDRTAAERKALVDRLAAVEVEANAEMPKLHDALLKAADKVRAAQERLQAATAGLSSAATAKLSASVTFDRCRDDLRQQLRAGADNATIDAFRSWLLDQRDAARHSPIESVTVGALRNEITGKRQSARIATNKASIDARLSAILDAYRTLDDLRLIADQREVARRIDAIKSSLPAIEPPAMPQEGAP